VGVSNLQYREGGGRIGVDREWYRPKERWSVPIGFLYIFLYQHSLALNFRLQFWVYVVANPNLGEGPPQRVGDGTV